MVENRNLQGRALFECCHYMPPDLEANNIFLFIRQVSSMVMIALEANNISPLIRPFPSKLESKFTRVRFNQIQSDKAFSQQPLCNLSRIHLTLTYCSR